MNTNRCQHKHNIPVKRFFFFLSLLCIVAVACNKESSGISDSPHALLSAYAVVPKAPELNLLLNGNTVAVSVPFGSYTLYNNVSPGMVAIKAQSSSRSFTIDTSFSLAENEYYSLFFTGTVDNSKAVLLHDSFLAPDSGYCGLRFLVLSPGTPNMDLHIVKGSTIKDSIWAKRSYDDNIANDSINIFKKFATGTYSFYALDRSNSKDTLARLINKAFTDSSNYTLMLEGLYNKSTNDTSLVLGTRLH